MQLQVNGQARVVPDEWADDTLADVLREVLGLMGTKRGCGTGDCGCCTVHVDGQPSRSCLTTARAVEGRSIVTVEGLAGADGTLHPVQQAWLDERVAQCGYCQGGQIMEAVALLSRHATPTDEQVTATFAHHPCRCGTQSRIRRAVSAAAQSMAGQTDRGASST